MLVVADSSPLHYLILVDAIEVLPRLYARVLVPHVVTEELAHPHTPEQVRLWMASLPPWLEVQPPRRLDDPILLQLDPGESQASLLAQELQADFLLMDDEDGRRAAHQRALSVLGTLGVLARAAEQGLHDLSIALARLRATDFRMTETMLQRLLARDAERKRQG